MSVWFNRRAEVKTKTTPYLQDLFRIYWIKRHFTEIVHGSFSKVISAKLLKNILIV